MAYSGGSSCASDRSGPVYETIDDSDSQPDRVRPHHSKDPSASECEFCECGYEHCSENDGSQGYASYDAPVFYKNDLNTGDFQMEPQVPSTIPGGGYIKSRNKAELTYQETPLILPNRPTEEPPGPCPPMFTDGFYDDGKSSQTLPMRTRKQFFPQAPDSGVGEMLDTEHCDADETDPLNGRGKGSSRGDGGDLGGGGDGSMRRRPHSGHYREADYNGQRRPIPALHSQYFVASVTQDDTVS